ncbi:MAG: RNA polymerase sigma factor [Leucobacter sp.]
MWLFGIARNTLMHVRRGNLRRARLANRLRDSFDVRYSPPSDTGIEVRDALSRMEDELAELIRLVHWDGFSLVEAAALLEIPPSTARGRYQRGKQAIRDALTLEHNETRASKT